MALLENGTRNHQTLSELPLEPFLYYHRMGMPEKMTWISGADGKLFSIEIDGLAKAKEWTKVFDLIDKFFRCSAALVLSCMHDQLGAFDQNNLIGSRTL